MKRAWKNPRPTLAAYGAPLVVTPKRDMALEEALVRALVAARRDPTLVVSVPVVLLDNVRTLDSRKLLREAREYGVESELGMMLALTAKVGRRRTFARLARLLRSAPGAPLGGVSGFRVART
jgi:hypothetical protein